MENVKSISEFNESAFVISRIHNIWLDCRSFRESGRLLKWKWALDSLELELKYDAKKLDIHDDTKFIDSLKKVNELIILSEKERNYGSYYNCLKDKEILLREVQQECGKGSRYKNPDEDDLD